MTQNTDRGVQSIQAGTRLKDIFKWLSPPDPSADFVKAHKQHHPGTGQWFLGSAAYSNWKRESSSFLWLNGMPGCGKTILSSTIIADMEESIRTASSDTMNGTLLYFFFSFQDIEKQSLDKAVRSLITQLYRTTANVRSDVDLLYASHQDGCRQPHSEALLSLLQTLLRKSNDVWLVLDALDEHEDGNGSRAKELLPWIRSLRQGVPNAHVLVTSRPEPDIKSATEKWASCPEMIPLGKDAVAEDIDGYIRSMVLKMERWRFRPDVQEMITTVLSSKADGM